MPVPPVLHVFDTSDAVKLFVDEMNIINGLWTVFVAATFAAAGYGLSGAKNRRASIAVMCGFIVFAAGHWGQMYRAIVMSSMLASQIQHAINQKDPYYASLMALVGHPDKVWVSGLTHLSIDLCAIAALLWRAFAEAAEEPSKP